MPDNKYLEYAKFLVSILPHIAREKCFALKGGTAINFFIRDLPRLSIDIDLAYIPIEDRKITFANINSALHRVILSARKSIADLQCPAKIDVSQISKVIIKKGNVQIKIEPNIVFRGSVYPSAEKEIVKKAEQLIEQYVAINTLSFADLYGSKLCAALDRQHPRDIFDIKILLENEGITKKVQKAFIVYLISHNRPINELLNPKLKDITASFNNEFEGMTTIDVTLKDLLKTRERYFKFVNEMLTQKERLFLLSMKMGEPDWNLLGLTGIDSLPAVQWKLENIRKLDKKKHMALIQKLRRTLQL